MLFDTDVLIFVQHGNKKAAKWVEKAEQRLISVQTYMELLQGAQNKEQHLVIKHFLRDFAFETIPLSENIGHRAAIYVETYALSHAMRAADAVIAATAMEHGLTLASANAKHFKAIKELDFKVFKP